MRTSRFKHAVIFAAALLASGQVRAAPIKILAFGTSLTQGLGLPPGTEYTTVLQEKLKAAGVDAKIVNAGVSGDTSADGLSRIDWSLADRPQAAIVEMGSNDALRGLSPAQTEKNLSATLAKLKAAHIAVLLCGMHAPRNLGKQYDVLFYPFILDGVALNPKLNQADGIHPNPAGVKIIVSRILPYVQQLIGARR
jgi:acyl-CoA thioesterase-1